MQSPEAPQPAVPPRRSRAPLLIGGCLGCGCLTAIGLVVALVFALRPERVPPPIQYVGQWNGADGTYIEIGSNGAGSMRSQGSTVTNGAATVDEAAAKLSIKMAGIGGTWHIDEAPREVDGVMQMTLDRVVFRKEGWQSTPAAGSLSSASVPTEAQLRDLNVRTLLVFNDCVKAGDFTELHAQASRQFREQWTPARLKETFAGFIQQGVDIAAIQTVDHSMSAPKRGADGEMITQGVFATTPRKVEYRLTYVPDGTWKLLGIKVTLR